MATTISTSDVRVETSRAVRGYTLPQRLGVRLALPMFAMAIGFFVAGTVVGVIRSERIADGASADTIATLQHVGPGLMFLGFAAAFAGISFAIARILGQFRKGGSEVQQAAGASVHTLATPTTAKLFLGGLMMGMVTLVAASILHFVVAGQVSGIEASLADAEDWLVVLEGVRRLGVGIFLAAIALGLTTIIRVLRFQAIRMRQLGNESRRA